VHDLDEARGYASLMQIEPEVYTVETLAEEIGRSGKYVYSRLRLLHLVEEIQSAFYNRKLSVAHASKLRGWSPKISDAPSRNAFRIIALWRQSSKIRGRKP
jgi:hypothetical protein